MHAKLEGYTIGFGIEPSGSDRTLGNGIENPRDRTEGVSRDAVDALGQPRALRG